MQTNIPKYAKIFKICKKNIPKYAEIFKICKKTFQNMQKDSPKYAEKIIPKYAKIQSKIC